MIEWFNKQWWRNSVVNYQFNKELETEDEDSDVTWWKNAIIYQIFPWSFLDTTGNGTGDLNGIIKKLDYIKALGVDAIWLTPIYESPMKDMGYDITNMEEIDPLFGEMQDFQKLLDIAHGYGLKIILDQVWNHTSDQHPWFVESCQSRDNPKSDWYVWADPKEDGSPPNNWLSAFMGSSAWQWNRQRQQYFLANFLPNQPELNWYNEEVVQTILNKAKFWLEKGVDGFRIDAVNFFLHDAQLHDNPTREADMPLPDGIDPNNPMVKQQFTNSFCRPETFAKLQPIRELLDQYAQVVSLGEVTLCEDSIALSSQYIAGKDRLHLVYNSALLQDQPLTATMLQNVMNRIQSNFPHGGQCWMVGNHDYGRLRSRWTGKDSEGEAYPENFYQMIAVLLVALPGALCLYQGDELGLPEAQIPQDIPVNKIRDAFGEALYPLVVGRDGSRTPMPWQGDKPNCGFTKAEEAWLPIPAKHQQMAVDLQTMDHNSLLNTWRKLLNWRKQQPAILRGDFQLLATEEPIFAFMRIHDFQKMLCLFNVSKQRVCFNFHDLDIPIDQLNPIFGIGYKTIDLNYQNFTCPPYSALLLNLSST